MLTARDAVPDRVAGLEAGADDYLVKPFAIQELIARLRALTRRGSDAHARAAGQKLQLGETLAVRFLAEVEPDQDGGVAALRALKHGTPIALAAAIRRGRTHATTQPLSPPSSCSVTARAGTTVEIACL